MTGLLTIPSSVTTIGTGCFSFTGFTSLKLNKNLTTINAAAFGYCTKLAGTLTIPDKVTYIGPSAFRSAVLIGLTLGSSVETIGQEAFAGGLRPGKTPAPGVSIDGPAITIPASVRSIGGSAFLSCKLSKVTLTAPPSGATVTVSANAFDNAVTTFTTKPSLTIPAGYSIAQNAFNGCKFNGVTVSNGATLAANCFKDNTGISGRITLGGTADVGTGAFQGCTGITAVTLQAGRTNIPTYLFSGCTALTGTLSLPAGLTTIGNYAFYGCSLNGPLSIPGSVQTIGISAFTRNKFTSLTTSGSVAGTRLTIMGNAFASAFTNLQPPAALTIRSNQTIKANAYASCGFTNVLIEAGAVLENAAFKGNTALKGRVTVNGASTIGSEAFMGCTGITGVVIAAGTTTIPASMFRECTALAGRLTIPASVTSLGDYAFYGCSGLTELSLPDAWLKAGGESTFENCSELQRLYDGTTQSKTLTVGGPQFSTIPASLFLNCKKLDITRLVIAEGVTTVRQRAFMNLEKLRGERSQQNLQGKSTSLSLPSTLTALYELCFSLGTVPGPGTTQVDTYFSTYKCSATTPPLFKKAAMGTPATSTPFGTKKINLTAVQCSVQVPSASVQTYKSSPWGTNAFPNTIFTAIY